MRRFALLLLAGASSLAQAQGFGVYEQNTCTMGRAGVAAAKPCADGSAIYFNPAGLASLGGNRFSVGTTLIGAQGSFTDDVLGHETDLDNPIIPVPSIYFTHALTPALTAGIGLFVPYGLQTNWPSEGFEGRFVGYHTDIRSIYVQPTVGYQVSPKLKLGIGIAYIASRLELKQRADLSTQVIPPTLAALFPSPLPPGTRFSALGIPTGTDFADAKLRATGSGFAVNFGAILQLTDRLSLGGHWLTRRTIDYNGTATFTPVPTNLALPVAIGPLPAGTPVDALLTAQFGPGGSLENGDVSTSIIMPPQGTIGFSWRTTDTWTVMADYQYVVWGWFSTVNIDFKNAATPDLTLHPNNNDTHGFRFGTEYQYSSKIQLRGGYLYHTAASPPEFVTPLLPEGTRNEVTIGAGIDLTSKLRADLGYQYIRQNDRRGLISTTGGTAGLYQFSAHLFGIGAAFTF